VAFSALEIIWKYNIITQENNMKLFVAMEMGCSLLSVHGHESITGH
jgi:hypothetical protein